MTFVLLVSLAAVMAAVMVMAWSLTVTLRPGEKLLRSLEAFEMVRRGAVPVAQRSLAERIRIVARRQCGILGKALMLPNSEARLSKQLSYAGNPLDWPMDRVIAAKGAVAIVGLFLGPFFGNAFGGGSGAVLGLILGPIGGFLLPNLLVYNAGTKHQANLQNTLTDVLDTMVISVEAGLGFDAALAQVAANGRGRSSARSCACCRSCSWGARGRRRSARWRHARRWWRSTRSSARSCRPPTGVSRSPGCCVNRRTRCACSDVSGRRKQPRRCRSRSCSR